MRTTTGRCPTSARTSSWSFGQWDADPARPLDRWPINEEVETRTRNIHLMLPFEAEVDAGGAVSFIISGFHQILIYGPGRELADVKARAVGLNLPPFGPFPPLVNYTTDLVYRGPTLGSCNTFRCRRCQPCRRRRYQPGLPIRSSTVSSR